MPMKKKIKPQIFIFMSLGFIFIEPWELNWEKRISRICIKNLAIATWKLLGWKVVGWRRQRLRIWRRKCTESILLCFVLTDLCVASISDNLRTTVIAQPRTRLAVNRMIAQNFKSLLIHEKSNWLLFFCFWFLFQRLAEQIGYET